MYLNDLNSPHLDSDEPFRPEMLKLLPKGSQRVLDVGCSNGVFGRSIKKTNSCEVWGIEPRQDVAELAKKFLDRVLIGQIENLLSELPDHSFDVIFFNDVLEHLIEPEEILIQLTQKLKPDGVFILAIPNVRYFRNLKSLVVDRDWEYQDWGILDKTHLRFYTQKSILRMFQKLNFEVLHFEGINATRSYRPYFYNILTFGIWGLDTRFLQFSCVVRPLKDAHQK
jgi:2-polyprenyl-3-methyl-5-hydroxy-6-metoxy-1,4-benzoquinol methylase